MLLWIWEKNEPNIVSQIAVSNARTQDLSLHLSDSKAFTHYPVLHPTLKAGGWTWESNSKISKFPPQPHSNLEKQENFPSFLPKRRTGHLLLNRLFSNLPTSCHSSFPPFADIWANCEPQTWCIHHLPFCLIDMMVHSRKDLRNSHTSEEAHSRCEVS
jgi:hypothetical protein